MREAGPADPLRVAERREIGYPHHMKSIIRNVGEIHGDSQAGPADGWELVSNIAGWSDPCRSSVREQEISA